MKKLVILTVVVAFAAAAAVYGAAKTGTVKLANKGMALELVFEGDRKVVVNNKGTRFAEGTYTPKSFILMAQDRSGTVWKLECSGTLGDLTTFTVTAGETTELKLGPPLTIRGFRYATQMTTQGKVIPIGLEVKGQAGEIYADGIRMGSRTVPAPYFQILDENDKVLVEAKFEYG